MATLETKTRNSLTKLLVAFFCVLAVVFLFKIADRITPARTPDIILITAGSLSPSHLPPYGYTLMDTPAIEDLSRGSFMFTNARACVPLPPYSCAAVMTGEHPRKAIRRKGPALFLNAPGGTLAQILKTKGYKTKAIIGSPSISYLKGIDKGFDKAEYIPGPSRDGISAADNITRKALSEIKDPPQAPFFLWIDYPLPKLDPRNRPDQEDTLFAPYDKSIIDLDHQINLLLKNLELSGRLKSSLIVFTSFTGEALGEHNELGHGLLLYDTTLRIPLFIKPHNSPMPRKKIKAPVTHSDIFSTILTAAGFRIGRKERYGVDIISSREQELIKRSLYIASDLGTVEFGGSSVAGLIHKGLKCVASNGKYELYDIDSDPYELNDIADEDPANYMRDDLLNTMRTVDPEMIKNISSGTDISTLLPISNALSIELPPTPRQRIKLYRYLLRKDPDNKLLNFRLALIYMNGDWNRTAEDIFIKLTNKYPDFTLAWEGLGISRDKLRERKAAIEAYRKALAIYPDMPISLNNLAWNLYLRKENLPSALEHARKANEIIPGQKQFEDTLKKIEAAVSQKSAE